MDKVILSGSTQLGDGTAKAEFGIDNKAVVAQVSIAFPAEKILAPVDKAIDDAMQKLKDAIPGNWEEGIIDDFKATVKEKLHQALGL